MEGLLGPGINPWLRRIVVRGVNVFPTLTAIYFGFNPLDLLVYSQVILSLLIPLPLIPIIYFTSRREFMGEFVNRRVTTVFAVLFAGVILLFNGYLLLTALFPS
jgi:manganese transport protein